MAAAKGFPLVLKSPKCEWLGLEKISVVTKGGPYNNEHGRGHGLQLGRLTGALFWQQEGKNYSHALRLAEDSDLSLDISHRKLNVGTPANTWYSKGHREWACKFQLNGDCTLSPAKNSAVCLGVKSGERTLSLVDRESENKLIFEDWTAKCPPPIFAQIRAEQEKMRTMLQSLGGQPVPLVIRKPACDWLWGQRHAIVVRGKGYSNKDGRGRGVMAGPVEDAILFKVDGGSPASMALRPSHDLDLSLEINYRKMEVGTSMSMWYCKGHPEWGCRYCLNSDWTISPESHANLVIGVQSGKQSLHLVSRDDKKHRIVFQPWKQAVDENLERIKESKARKEAAKERIKTVAAKAIDSKAIEKLKKDGFIHLPGIVEKETVNNALREINRLMGASSEGGADKFKAKFSPNSPPITNLFNNSAIPLIVQRLIGMQKAPSQGAGQIALRFPGDFCANGQTHITPDQYEGVRKGWHIDGAPSNFLPKVTDHWGEVHNFDALCGVLLSTVDEKMSGELCCYPGSHYELAEHFEKKGFDEIRKTGKLPNGKDTDSVLKSKPVHCLGKPGDVFIANYMTAHFIAPNVSPNIRYAIYFRVRGPSFTSKKHHPEPMLKPWIHWKGMVGSNAGDIDDSKVGDEEDGEPEATQARVGVLRRLASIDYVKPKSIFFDDGDDENPE